jgi:hypothetical protein
MQARSWSVLTLTCFIAAFISACAGIPMATAQNDSQQKKPKFQLSGLTPSTAPLMGVPSGVAFFDQHVGTQTEVNLHVNNSGTATLNVTSLTLTPGFRQNNTCASVAVGAQCTISVFFKPTSATTLNGTMTIVDNAPDSPQVVSLVGSGTNAYVSLLPASLNFGSQRIGTSSATMSVWAINVTGAPFTISNISTSGDFSESTLCGTTLTAGLGQACRIDLTFKPTAQGTRNGSLTIADSAPDSPHVVPLSGVGGAPALTFTPSTLTFTAHLVGVASRPQPVTVKNNGSTDVDFVSIVAAGDFSQTNNCGTSLPAGASCTVNVTFTSSDIGPRSGLITFNDTDPTNLQTVTMTGSGLANGNGVTISPRAASVTFKGTQQFQAMVGGVLSNNVTWQVDRITGGNHTVAGTISATGLYTPPAKAGSHTITAINKADSSQSAVVRVIVTDYAGTFTYHNDLARTGQNLNETVLNTGNVNAGQFGKLFSYAVDGKVFAQPLYVANLNIKSQGFHNVVLVATEHDSLYAFDADGRSTSPLWQRSFINPSAGVTTVSVGQSLGADVVCGSLAPEIGINGTPVIDSSTNILYLVARTKEVVGGVTNFVQRLHAIDITTGKEMPNSPVVIQGSFPGNGLGGDGFGNVVFDPLSENQRAGLLLMNGTIYIAWASFCDPPSFHGWIMAYDAGSLQPTSRFVSTPGGWAGGMWGGGSALAADASGNIFTATGNGTFDAALQGKNYGQSVLKLSTSGGLSVGDSFTPYDGIELNTGDLDLDSGGVMLLPDQPSGPPHLLLAAGKQGTLYLLNRDQLGGYDNRDDGQVVQELVHGAGGSKGGIWGKPAYWQNQVYYVGTNDVAKAFRLWNGQLSPIPASASSFAFHYPGSLPTISADGNYNGILWLVYENTPSGVPVNLFAYDAANLQNLLYQSATGVTTGKGVQFGVPTVANGKVYVGTASDLEVFGLLP